MTIASRGYKHEDVRWKPTPKGNFYTKDLNRGAFTTVFEQPDGAGFRFVSDSEFSEETYETIEEAQEAAEEYFGK